MQKSVLVTGCSSGIGLESALDLKRQGFNVLAACRKADDVARMQELGLTGILLDLDDPQSVERAAAEVIALTNNRLYGLFNNAGRSNIVSWCAPKKLAENCASIC